MNRFVASVGIVALFAGVASPSFADELIVNGGFEDTSMTEPRWYARTTGIQVTGWSLFDGTGIDRATDMTWLPSYLSGSSSALYMQAKAAVSQTVDVPEAGRYLLSFACVARRSNMRDEQLVVTIGGKEVWSGRVNNTAWETTRVRVTLEAGEQEVRFSGSKPADAAVNDTCLALDNVSLLPCVAYTVAAEPKEVGTPSPGYGEQLYTGEAPLTLTGPEATIHEKAARLSYFRTGWRLVKADQSETTGTEGEVTFDDLSELEGGTLTWTYEVQPMDPSLYQVRAVAREEDKEDDWADAYTDVQAAIAAVGEDGEVYFRNGHYDIAATLELTAANQTLTGESRDGVILDGGGKVRVLASKGKATPTIRRLTVTGGYLERGDATQDYGAGVYMSAGSGAYLVSDCVFTNNVLNGLGLRGAGFGSINNTGALVTNCLFTGNRTENSGNGNGGGAGYYDSQSSDSATLYSTVADCTFTNNAAHGNGAYGGAIWSARNIRICGCRFSDNSTTTTGSGSYGGTVKCGKYVETVGCVFEATTNNAYGGCISVSPDCIISNCVFRGNVMRNHLVDMNSNSLMTDCVFTNNVGSGRLFGSISGKKDVCVRNSLFAENCLDGSKGALSWGHTCLGHRIENCTVVGNGSAFFVESDYSYSTNVYVNCVFQGCGPQDSGAFRVVMTNSVTPVAPGGVGSSGVIVTNLAVRSAGRLDYRLPAGSPAVDGGVWLDWMDGAKDLADDPRVVGAAPDMGCYERQAGEVDPLWCTRAVATEADRKDEWKDAYVGIQTAVDAAYDGEPLYVKAGSYRLTAPVTVQNRDIRFCGEGVDKTILDGQGASRCLVAIIGSGARGDLTFDGFTFTNGCAGSDTSDANYKARGGGIYISCNQSARRITMSNCRITGCRQIQPLTAEGKLKDTQCYRGAGAYAVNYCTFRDCLIDNIVASNIYAAAVGFESAGSSVRGSGMLFSGCVVSNCTLKGSRESSSGSFTVGVRDFGSSPTWVENSTFVDLPGNFYDNALRTANGSTVTNCVFRRCTASYSVLAAGNNTSRVVDCLFEECGGTGFVSSAPAYDRCVFRNSTGHVWYGSVPGVIRNCLFTGNAADVFWPQNSSNARGYFENCAFVDNNGRGSSVLYYASDSQTNNVMAFVNCIFWGNTKDVSAAKYYETDLIAYTNCLVEAYTTAIPETHEGCIVGRNPRFVDRANGDYRLKTASPARDKGLKLDWMTAEATDLDRKPRVVTNGKTLAEDPSALPDIGCYENQAPNPGLMLLLR